MASICRSAISSGSRSLAARSKCLKKTTNKPSLIPRTISSPFASPTPHTRAFSIPSTSRLVWVLGSVDSLLPFHTATANSRLRSSIGLDASCWSFLSQGFATPL